MNNLNLPTGVEHQPREIERLTASIENMAEGLYTDFCELQKQLQPVLKAQPQPAEPESSPANSSTQLGRRLELILRVLSDMKLDLVETIGRMEL